MKKFISFSMFLCCLTALLLAQDYEVSVTTISVWIKATEGSGKPVEGLTAADFEVYEDGKKMTATCFESTNTQFSTDSSTASTGETESLPEIPAKRIAIYLDLYNTTEAEFSNLQPRMEDFLDQIEGKNWEVMFTELSSGGMLEVVVPYTKDLQSIRSAIDLASGSNRRDMTGRTRIKELSFILENYIATKDEGMLQAAYAKADEYALDERNSAEFSVESLREFTGYLAKRDSGVHTVVLFVSGGINIDPGRVYYETIEKAVGSGSGSRGTFMSADRRNNLDVLGMIKKSVGQLNRQNITVYAVNTRGMYTPDNTRFDQRAVPDDPSFLHDFQDSMAQIAEETGGISFQNSQNFKFGFDQILTDLGQQYLICYNPPEHKKPGQYHKIKVSCKRKGVNLRYRKGYLD